MEPNQLTNKDTSINIDDEDISPASIPHNPHGIFLDFKFCEPKNKGETTGLTLSEDSLTGFNHGVGWRTLLGDTPIIFNNLGKYYFEVRLTNHDDSWGNGIGLADSMYFNASSNSILGYVQEGKSWSWFSYKGSLQGFITEGKICGEKPSYRYKTGDVIKIVVDSADRSISYYCNEEFIGTPFVNIESASPHSVNAG